MPDVLVGIVNSLKMSGWLTRNMFCINVHKRYVYYFHTRYVLELLSSFFNDFCFYLAWIYFCGRSFSCVVNITF